MKSAALKKEGGQEGPFLSNWEEGKFYYKLANHLVKLFLLPVVDQSM